MKNYIIRILPNPGPRINSGSSSTLKTRPQISSPINFDHVLHVGFNGETGEFEGLPPEWERLLSNSGITPMERKENPDTIIAVKLTQLEMNSQTKATPFLATEISRRAQIKQG